MLIAGGLYRELCEVPTWDTTLGSGGRAAMTLAALGAQTTLHTYACDSEHHITASLRSKGIAICAMPRPTPIAFAYFHPLSTPHIEPKPGELQRCAPLLVEGENVLRYGFLEGDAVVKADWAVYDPQTWRSPMNFHDNGSTAKHLGLVLNEAELLSLSDTSDINEAADQIFVCTHAEVIVVKMGVHGALVIEPSGKTAKIPAYRTPSVFKIGSGDVFTAAFSYFWAERKYSSVDAALEASRHTAAYCATKRFDFEPENTDRHQAISNDNTAKVWILGDTTNLGQRYVIEEARYNLTQLGVTVYTPSLDKNISAPACDVTLVIDDDIEQAEINKHLKQHPSPIIRLVGRTNHTPIIHPDINKTNDFTTALYWASWAKSRD